ncbi:uracil-DNA glycosylase [Neorhodopirellula pilleata]|uniref:Type-4 uracil-DNA glycosylase n=1 Tax=Neorhodopirellula pilleata TaxID=2714738 RepID=A0A5C5ZRG7_9BACT|nr:uracil-DNA glycosylase [Neorhodopirellula pilleata]TWT89391.1 Uracil DNA glycosylase superfamily protein [Neorhodopirellula pilleata]
MTKTESTTDQPLQSLDAGEIAAAGHELLEHLRRSGIRFVPIASQHGVESWSTQFASEAEAAVTSSADPAPPASASVDSPLKKPVSAAAGPAVSPAVNPATSRLAPVAAVRSDGSGYSGGALPLADREAVFAEMAGTVSACTRCKELAACRTHTVFGEGNLTPRFVFFGEGPGADEDATGRPFVGKAGQLLTKMIEACKLSRDEVYILNTVKCRPPGNRNPAPGEIANCREYFEKQFEILQPEYIICLGAVPSQALLNTKLSVGRLRQTFHQYRDSKVLVIYHPAYLLREPEAKRAAWADLQMLMKDAGLG